ncbi:MAG TPA: hypothetical protein PKU97_15510 [Kofleriaceae bacterium]|nr:hypothetical protein [Kofleriaceae bacterium]
MYRLWSRKFGVCSQLGLMTASALACLTWAPTVRADATAEVKISFNADGQRLAEELGLDVEGFRQDVTDKVSDALQLSEVQRFLRSFADASSFSNRGIGVDYASNSDRYILGLAANIAVSADLGDEDDGDVPTVGLAPNFTLMGGVNLAPWHHPEIVVFGNLFHTSSDSGSLHGGITSVGLHAQYKMFTPTRGLKRYLVQWGGLDFTGGVEFARWKLGLRGELSHDFEFTGAADTASTVTAAVTGRFDVGATTVTMPLEVTTNLRFLYVASLYVGMGLDVQAGRASIGAGTTGTLRATRPDAPDTVETIGEVSASASGSNSPSPVGYHLLLGLQANLWRLKVFAQASVRPISDVSVAAGLRVVL